MPCDYATCRRPSSYGRAGYRFCWIHSRAHLDERIPEGQLLPAGDLGPLNAVLDRYDDQLAAAS